MKSSYSKALQGTCEKDLLSGRKWQRKGSKGRDAYVCIEQGPTFVNPALQIIDVKNVPEKK